jgi:secreted trypsin-like serine protease
MMRSLFMIGATAAVTAVFAFPAAVSADPVRSALRSLKPTANLRVIGGTAALEGAWPWQVYVQIPALSGGRKVTMRCGGSVIAPRWILTAAHCLQNLDTSQSILVGEQQSSAGASRAITDLDSRGHRVVRTIIHPRYRYNPARPETDTHENDIALLRLAEDVRSSAVVPLLTADPVLESPPVRAFVTGWGRMHEVDALGNDPVTHQRVRPEDVEPQRLMEVKIPLVTTSQCKASYQGAAGVIDGRTLCAGVPEGGKDSCQGDSGGPLVTQNTRGDWVQIGVVSWGAGCGRRGFPGIYTRVSAFADFIRQNVGAELAGRDEQVATTPEPPPPGTPDDPASEPPQDPKFDNPAGLAIEFDKGDMVHVGDKVAYRVSANQAGFLTIFDLGPDGNLKQIFPNERALRSPTGAISKESLRLKAGLERLIPDYRNPYAAFEVRITEPRGKGVIVAVLSEQPLTETDIPALPRKFESRKAAVSALGKMRNALRATRGLLPEPEPPADDAPGQNTGAADNNPGAADPPAGPSGAPVTPDNPGDMARPGWSVVIKPYEVQ